VSDFASGNGQREDGLPPSGTGRRRSLVILVALLVGLPLAFFLRTLLVGQEYTEVGFTDTLANEGVIYVPRLNIFLVDGDPPLALLAESSHVDEEPIAYCPTAEVFEEYVHGSKWDRSGLYLTGPAPRGMDRLALRIRKDGAIEVDPSTVIQGPPRGTTPVQQPVGPYCGFDEPTSRDVRILEGTPPGA
jgi:hypothetical protein